MDKTENSETMYEELEAQNRAANIAYFVSFGICLIVSLLSFIFTSKINAGIWMIFFGMLSAVFLVRYIKLKRKHEFWIFISYVFLFIMLTSTYIFQLLGKI